MANDETMAEGSAVVKQELGTLEVAEQVFRDLAMKAIGSLEGVASVGRPGGIFRRRSAAQGVQIERGQGEVAFAIQLSVRYDVRIPELVEELRQRIRDEVEGATGYKVRVVNVTVEHIAPPELQPEAPQSPAEAAEGKPEAGLDEGMIG